MTMAYGKRILDVYLFYISCIFGICFNRTWYIGDIEMVCS